MYEPPQDGGEARPTPADTTEPPREAVTSSASVVTEATPSAAEHPAGAPGTPGTRVHLPPLPAWARLPMSARAAWVATAVSTLLAAVLRLVGLDRITTLVFDETY